MLANLGRQTRRKNLYECRGLVGMSRGHVTTFQVRFFTKLIAFSITPLLGMTFPK